MSSDSQNKVNIFEEASRLKLRFLSSKGLLDTEQLWDLHLTSEKGDSLDSIARATAKVIREAEETESFVSSTKNTGLSENRLRLEILKSIISTKQADNKSKADAQEKAATKKQVLEVLSRKQAAALETLSEEELLEKLKG